MIDMEKNCTKKIEDVETDEKLSQEEYDEEYLEWYYKHEQGS